MKTRPILAFSGGRRQIGRLQSRLVIQRREHGWRGYTAARLEMRKATLALSIVAAVPAG
ncbi:MAG: hypothetical protein ACHQ0J_02395 [Candidatus Dormibacterales bacterium]